MVSLVNKPIIYKKKIILILKNGIYNNRFMLSHRGSAFQVWLRKQLLSAELRPIISQTEV